MKKFPAVRMLLTVGIGLPLGRFLESGALFLGALTIASTVVFAIVFVVASSALHRRSGRPGSYTEGLMALLYLCALVLGGSFVGTVIYRSSCNPYAQSPVLFPVLLRGSVEEITGARGGTRIIKLYGQIHSANLPTHAARVLIRAKGKLPERLRVHSQVLCLLELRPPVMARSDLEFNEIRYTAQNDAMWHALVSASASNTGAQRSSHNVITVMDDGSHAPSVASRIRAYTSVHIDSLFHPEYRELAKALLLGDDSMLDGEIRESFTKSGTAHLLAVSGMHITAIASLLAILFAGISHRFLRLVLTAVPVLLFVGISGGEASTLRAGVAFVAAELVRRIGRVPQALNILAAVALLMIVSNPANAQSAGFYLSFAAVAGIHFFYQHVRVFVAFVVPTKNTLVQWILASTALSLAVSLLTVPVGAFFFSTLSVSAPISNLVSVPASLLATAGIALSSITSVFSSDIGYVFAALAEWSMMACITWNTLASEVPGAFLHHEAAIIAAFAVSGTLWYAVKATNKSTVHAVRRLVLHTAVSICTVVWFYGARPTTEFADGGWKYLFRPLSLQHGVCVIYRDSRTAPDRISHSMTGIERAAQAFGYDTLTIIVDRPRKLSGDSSKSASSSVSPSVVFPVSESRSKLNGIVVFTIPAL